ncbi:RF-1 domain [Rhizoctonia solani]|uniref:Mitochondrial zinc maintenance protein 1, mitochondrial n=1 Tax=Rhizoctonia solani TaxID=456999 RepID=A0A8H7IJG2_9AGAM|nr:RF-1 domain [Rhizoctonia solani]
MTSPITPALKSSARSAYRSLFRASGTTFAGDDRVLYAFRDKVRTETVAGQQEADPVEYEARVKHAFEVADVLKKNVVQGVKEKEGEDATWKLRMTPDTELGSNEGVKAPYSRPARGTPRTKCGEDPNAVAPLPPRSLRHMVGSNPTRLIIVLSSSELELGKSTRRGRHEEKYDRIRVQSLRNRLLQVNRRVLASPTGRERTTERTLVEDKLATLVARMEFLATEMHDRLYPPSSNSAPARPLVDLLLDQIPISPKCSTHFVGPPVQLQQYIRFLQSAAKHTNAVRTETILHTPEVRKAIAQLIETPAPGTRRPDNASEQLQAIQWRMLMIKRGLQGVVKSRTISPSLLTPMFSALREAMQDISYAQECIQDLEDNGPRLESARTLVEDMEKSLRGSCIMELRKQMEGRFDAGVAGKRVDDAIVGLGLSPSDIKVTRKAYRRIRHYEEFPSVVKTVTKAQQDDDLDRAKRWRRKLFARGQKVFNAIRLHMNSFTSILDQMIALHSRDDDKVLALCEARQELNLLTDVSEDQLTLIAGKATYASWSEWADVMSDRLALVEELAGTWDLGPDRMKLFFDARVELVIICDLAWRLERRMKYDIEGVREASVLLCEEVQSEFEFPEPRTRGSERTSTRHNSLEKSEFRIRSSRGDRGRPKSHYTKDPKSTNDAVNTVLILDE